MTPDFFNLPPRFDELNLALRCASVQICSWSCFAEDSQLKARFCRILLHFTVSLDFWAQVTTLHLITNLNIQTLHHLHLHWVRTNIFKKLGFTYFQCQYLSVLCKSSKMDWHHNFGHKSFSPEQRGRFLGQIALEIKQNSSHLWILHWTKKPQSWLETQRQPRLTSAVRQERS